MSSWSALSIYADAATLTNGATISATENNTERTNNRDWDIDVRVEGIATERHHNSASEPDDTSDGVIWSDSGNTLLKWRNGGAWENVAIATNANTWTANQTLANTIDLLVATDGGSDLGATAKRFGTIFVDASTITDGITISGADKSILFSDAQNFVREANTATRLELGAQTNMVFFIDDITGAENRVGGFQSDGAVARFTVGSFGAVTGNIGIGVGAPPTALENGIYVLNGVAASAALSNGVSAWAADDGASLSEWVFMSEGLTKYHLGGSADEDVDVGGVVFRDSTAVGNVGSGEDDLMTYTMPADLLDVDGKAVRVTAWGSGNVTDNITLKYHIGTTEGSLNSGSTTGRWHVTIIIQRTGATAQVASAHYIKATATPFIDQRAPAETLSGTVVIKFTGENTSDTTNDAVTQLGMIIEVLN